MKTILISDIGGKQETIIPYALNFTKYINNSISIIHAVDSRMQHAVSSAYADSQSFEVGSKLSHKEILEREKHHTRQTLDKILSKEASRLNFPLRVNTLVEESTIENMLSNELDADKTSLIIGTSKLKGTIVSDLEEFFETTRKFNSLSLIVPPEYCFSIPKNALIQFDFNQGINDRIYKVLELLKAFDPLISVMGATEQDKLQEMIIKGEAWQKEADNYMKSSLRITTNILAEGENTNTLLDFIQRNNFDLVAIPDKMKVSTGINFMPRDTSKQLIAKLNIPVLLY